MKFPLLLVIFMLVMGVSCGDKAAEDSIAPSGLAEKVEDTQQEKTPISRTFEVDVPIMPLKAVVESATAPPPIAASPIAAPIYVPIPVGEPEFMSHSDDDSANCDDNDCVLGFAAFSTVSPANWYPVDTHPYPQTVLLSKNRNQGYVKGDISLDSEGFTVDEGGTYWVSFDAVLTTFDTEHSPLITVALVPNNDFDPNNFTTQIDSVVSLPAAHDISPTVETAHGEGILLDLEPMTTLSLVATHNESLDSEIITVIHWSINIHKICD